MKKLILILFIALSLVSCGNNKDSEQITDINNKVDEKINITSTWQYVTVDFDKNIINSEDVNIISYIDSNVTNETLD